MWARQLRLELRAKQKQQVWARQLRSFVPSLSSPSLTSEAVAAHLYTLHGSQGSLCEAARKGRCWEGR
jgi:hypothetical protein